MESTISAVTDASAAGHLKKLERQKAKEIRNEKRLSRRSALGLPVYSVGEEVFSAVTHGVGALLSILGLVLLLVNCRRDPLVISSAAVFGGSMVLLYTVSTIYHGLGVTKGKKVFRVLDHCTIFLLIAGTYTPITLCCIKGREGFTMLAVVWAAAVIGIVLNSIDIKKFAKFSMFCYIAMGWIVVWAMKPLIANLSRTGLIALFVGGIFYTVGAVVYGIGKKVRYMHSIWHFFVLAGSIAHTITVFQILC